MARRDSTPDPVPVTVQNATSAGNPVAPIELRDYVAVKALVAFLAIPTLHGEATETLARWSYKQADAMLTARTAPPSPPQPMGLCLDDECPPECWCQGGGA